MIDRYIAPALTFAMLISGHLAIAMAMLSTPETNRAMEAASTPVVQLAPVLVTAKRVS